MEGCSVGSVDVDAQRLDERVMARHTVLFAASLMKPDCPSGAAWPEVFDLHPQGHRLVQNAIVARMPRIKASFSGLLLAPLGIPAPGLITSCASACNFHHGAT